MATYKIDLQGDVLRIGFADPAQNDVIVREAVARLEELNLPGGKIIKLNGPASLPVAVVIAHNIGHLYETVAVFDPKLSKYVVSISHGDTYKLGDLID